MSDFQSIIGRFPPEEQDAIASLYEILIGITPRIPAWQMQILQRDQREASARARLVDQTREDEFKFVVGAEADLATENNLQDSQEQKNDEEKPEIPRGRGSSKARFIAEFGASDTVRDPGSTGSD